jgi:hypothetical protein
MRPLLRAAYEQNYHLSRTGTNHIRVVAPRPEAEGRITNGSVTLPSTPSDTRTVSNSRAALRRIGVEFPH